MSLSKPWRPYQREADEHISFTVENKRLVKMFCGTGKSLLNHRLPIERKAEA